VGIDGGAGEKVSIKVGTVMKRKESPSRAERNPPVGFRALRKAYLARKVVLALGAGVSKGCGLPDWNQLVRSMVRKYLDQPRPSYGRLADYFEQNPLRMAALVRDRFRSQAAFADAIRRELYDRGRFRRYYNRKFQDIAFDFLRFVKRTNPTLHAVANLCAEDVSWGRDSLPNPCIRAVVNFNFDAIFRLYVHGRFGPRILRTIERVSAAIDPFRISVYHIHGYLQFLATGMDQRFESPDLITFSETDYFDVFDRSGTIFNYTLRYLLREYSFIFIGLSMKDINLRRVLHYSISELRQSHLKETGRPVSPGRLRRHFAVLSARGLDSRMRLYAQRDLDRFGVRPLWVSGFSEIPTLLNSLR
jgi:hypothetical protein